MNNIINSSGVYDINVYNSISNNTAILSTLNVVGLTQLNTPTITSSLNVSGSTLLIKLQLIIHYMLALISIKKYNLF